MGVQLENILSGKGMRGRKVQGEPLIEYRAFAVPEGRCFRNASLWQTPEQGLRDDGYG